MKLTTLLLASAFLLGPLPAQKMSLAGDDSRALQLFDLADLVERPTGPDLALVHKLPDSPREFDLAAFFGRFLEPPLQTGDDVRMLGGRWLAVLGKPEQLASAERLLTIARARRNEHIAMESHILEMPRASFTALVEKLLPKAPADGAAQSVVLTKQAATELLAQVMKEDHVNVLQSPSLLAGPLQHCTMSVGDDVAYVKDYAIKSVEGRAVAEPVLDKIWDGLQIDLLVTFTAKDRAGVQCAVLQQKVEKPIAEFKTTIGVGTVPVIIQLPQCTSVRLQQTAELTLGSTVLIAAKKNDDVWLVAMVEVDRSPQ